MPLTEDQLNLIRHSFDVLRRDLESPSVYFYEDLFTRAPELRPLFRDDLAGQGMRFMSTLAVIVDNLHKPEALAERYADLGRIHARLGVTAAQFPPMGEALIATIRNTLGDRFTADIEAAWRVAYADFSRELIESGGIPEN